MPKELKASSSRVGEEKGVYETMNVEKLLERLDALSETDKVNKSPGFGYHDVMYYVYGRTQTYKVTYRHMGSYYSVTTHVMVLGDEGILIGRKVEYEKVERALAQIERGLKKKKGA